ncbi:MAG: GNAT family N-acetyltransferase [Schleiferiaceae bacterium]|nr:GNAT family N-acetyltransferase [Schleiferiaceae bacterium]
MTEVQLQLLKQSDYSMVLEMFREPDTFKYIKPLQGKSKEFYLEFLNRKSTEIELGKGYYWLLMFSGEMAGAINFTPIPNTDQMQLGWQIKRDHQRKGLAFEGARRAMEFALNKTDVDPIYVVFNPENVASQKIAEKLGFTLFEKFGTKEDPLLKYIYRRKGEV